MSWSFFVSFSTGTDAMTHIAMRSPITINPSIIVTGPTRLDANILLEIKVKSNQLDNYDISSEIDFDCVFASKKGEVLETKFIPFKLSDIKKQ